MLISAHTGQTSKYNSVEVKLQWQKFIHLLNGASQGNYFLPKSHKFAFLKKKSLQEHLWQPKLQTWLFSTGTYASIGTKLCRYRVWKCYEKYKKKKKLILGQNDAVLALGPGLTGHFTDKKIIIRHGFLPYMS